MKFGCALNLEVNSIWAVMDLGGGEGLKNWPLFMDFVNGFVNKVTN